MVGKQEVGHLIWFSTDDARTEEFERAFPRGEEARKLLAGGGVHGTARAPSKRSRPDDVPSQR
jgi:hypothetical protein